MCNTTHMINEQTFLRLGPGCFFMFSPIIVKCLGPGEHVSCAFVTRRPQTKHTVYTIRPVHVLRVHHLRISESKIQGNSLWT